MKNVLGKGTLATFCRHHRTASQYNLASIMHVLISPHLKMKSIKVVKSGYIEHHKACSMLIFSRTSDLIITYSQFKLKLHEKCGVY